jgi:bifunctional non-homologous end joining protein LigD
MCAVALKRSDLETRPPAEIPGATPAPFPGFLDFCDPSLREHPPAGHGWVHEIKIDGYRAGLLGLVEMDVVEVHPWATTVDDIEHPDHLVFDLDPRHGVEWEFVTETALKLRELLRAEGRRSWPKVTGGKGLHVMVPIERRMMHDAARTYARRLAQHVAAQAPDRYTISSAPEKRRGRIYIDYLRNGRGTTAVGAYSPRVRPGFPIAAPVTWAHVEREIRPDAYTIGHPFKPSARRRVE